MRLIEQPHHDGSSLYISDAAPRLGDVVTVWVRVPAAAGVGAVHLRTTPDGEPNFVAAAVDPERTGTAVGGYGATDVWWRAALTVRNPVTNYRFHLRTAAGDTYWLTAGGIVPGRWHKAANEAVTTYTDVDGTPVLLTPGRTWVALPSSGGATRF